jgi:membrane peptidoglycan carboxypeptidase
VSNSDVPGPYRQDSAGDYGSAEFGIGRNAGYGRSGSGGDADSGRGGNRHAAGRRRRTGPDPDPGDGNRGDGGRPSTRASAPPAGRSPQGPRSRAYPPAGAAGGQVADDLRDRLGVRGSRSGSDSRGYAAPGSGPRAPQAGARPARPARETSAHYSDEGYGGSRRDGGTSTGYRARGGDGSGGGRDGGGRGRGGGGYRGGPGGPNGLAPSRGPRRQRRSFGAWFKSGDWWRRWTWKKALGVAGAIVLGVPLVGLIAFGVAYEQTPIPTETSALATAAPSTVYFRNGNTIGTFSEGGLNRQILTSEQIPAVMNNAIVAAEDRHFYTEGGISVTGIARAAYADLRGGDVSQGGSTLTEQFVKNYYTGFASADNSDKNANDKLRQALVAIKLAHTKSKSWILTQYLNTVYLGENAYGVGAAAQVYFGESASKLSVSQAAMLAALANLPGYFQTDPHAGAPYTALVARWNYVIKNMVRDGALTPAQAGTQKFPVVHLHFSPSLDGYKGYLMQMVQQELSVTYGFTQAQIDTGGMKIYTTFSQQDMFELNQAVSTDKAAMAADGQPLPVYAHVGAVLEDPTTGAIEAVYGGPGYGVKNCEQVLCDLNMAEDPKQVGSSFKPYVLAAAVGQGMDVQDSVLNGYSPLWIPESQTMTGRLELSSRTPKTGAYLPFNEADENSGPVSARTAAAISSDPAFEDLAHRVGVQNLLGVVKSFGVGQTPFDQGDGNDLTALYDQFGENSHASTSGSVAISLGEGDLTAVEQASLFATLADGGVYRSPHVVSKITRGDVNVPLKVQMRQVLTTAGAADVDYALSADNIPGGTAYPQAAWPGYSVIGKTGTTQTAQDAWFIGAIPQQSLAVALFTNSQNSISGPGAQTLDILPRLEGNATGGYGGAWPAYIWHTFMTTAFAATPTQAWPTPDYTGFSLWNQVTGSSQPMPVKAKPTPSATVPTAAPSPSNSACVMEGNVQVCNPDGGGFTPPVEQPTPVIPTPQPSFGNQGSPPPAG